MLALSIHLPNKTDQMGLAVPSSKVEMEIVLMGSAQRRLSLKENSRSTLVFHFLTASGQPLVYPYKELNRWGQATIHIKILSQQLLPNLLCLHSAKGKETYQG
jgi:hypothetical protein